MLHFVACPYHRPRQAKLAYINVSRRLSIPKRWKSQMRGTSYSKISWPFFRVTSLIASNPIRSCPRCKTLRKATKTLSLSRLPPVLLIHLKRFSFKGPFTDKIEKQVVDFPLKGLDLTNYMLPPLPPGVDRTGTQTYPPEDPRLQIPPYRYDLYAVTNHFGSLSSGPCTFSISLYHGSSTDHVMFWGLGLTFFLVFQIPLLLLLEVAGYIATIAVCHKPTQRKLS